MRPIHPGEILREEYELTAADFKGDINLEAVLAERSPVTRGSAEKLSHLLGTTPEFWLNMQTAYDEAKTASVESVEILPDCKVSSCYGRSVVIWLCDEDCHVCGKAAPCISIDTSDDEYGAGNICRDCIDKAYSQLTKGSDSTDR